MKRLLALLFCLLLSVIPVRAAPANIYTVNSTLDLPDGLPGDNACATDPTVHSPPVCTLRAAVMEANRNAGPSFVTLPAATYVITQTGFDDSALKGDLDISGTLSIVSSGGQAVIDANGGVTADRAFQVITGSLTLQGLTIHNGNTASSGGAISAAGDVYLTNVVIENNSAQLDGGGIYVNGGNVQLTGSTIQNNTSQQSGGGVSIDDSSSAAHRSLSVSGTSFDGNRAAGGVGEGGGLNAFDVDGSMQSSTFHNNTAAYSGGGMQYVASLTGLTFAMTATDFISNSASTQGGGLLVSGHVSIAGGQVISNSAQSAGGIYAGVGAQNLSDVRVSHNQATAFSCGGIQVSGGSLNLTRGWIEANHATQLGGGLCTGGAGTIQLAITETNVLNNSASGAGGGVWVGNTFLSSRSAIYGNFAAYGGGIYSQGVSRIENSTLSGDGSGRDGGAIYAAPNSTLRLNSDTVAANRADEAFPKSGVGGGVYISTTAVVSAANSVIALNSNNPFSFSASDCFGALQSEDYNFIGSTAGCSVGGVATHNQSGNPQLAAFGWIGGSTPGMLPLAGSPLIDAANPNGCYSAITPLFVLGWDQIGHTRLGGQCDIGALEFFVVRRLYLPLVRR